MTVKAKPTLKEYVNNFLEKNEKKPVNSAVSQPKLKPTVKMENLTKPHIATIMKELAPIGVAKPFSKTEMSVYTDHKTIDQSGVWVFASLFIKDNSQWIRLSDRCDTVRDRRHLLKSPAVKKMGVFTNYYNLIKIDLETGEITATYPIGDYEGVPQGFLFGIFMFFALVALSSFKDGEQPPMPIHPPLDKDRFDFNCD